MIYKKDSSEFMKMFDKANASLSAAHDDITTLAHNLSTRMSIVTESLKYLNTSIQELKIQSQSGSSSDKVVFASSDIVDGFYSSFGMTYHPHLVKVPSNIFNFKSAAGCIYKDNATIFLGKEDVTSKWKHILMDDSIPDKEFFLEEFDTDEITLTVHGPSAGISGLLRWNMLEILPFIPGSFNITSMLVYEKGKNQVAHSLQNIENVSASRYILTEKVAFDSVSFKIKLKHQNDKGKYIFGLKHLYFLNADFNDKSYITVRIRRNKAIEYIYNDIVCHTQYGSADKTDTDDVKVKFYLDYENGVLGRELIQSTELEPIYMAINSSEIYMYVPLTTAFIAITPNIKVHT